ncbi:MAG: hypothetical protein ACRD1R_09800 [Acidobacteriota bacterium]
MRVLLLLLLLLQNSTGFGLLGPKQPVTPLSFNGETFKSAFNAASAVPRLVMIFSPT